MKQILYKLFEHQYLGRDEARTILQNIAQGKYNDVQVASLITVFLMRNISVEELCGFRDALLEMRIPVDLSDFAPIDIVGTGGDGKNTFNISTASCFTVAGAGFPVVKHGNYGAPPALADLAGDENIGQEVHFNTHNAVSLARLAAAALDIERKPPRLVAAHFRIVGLRKDLADIGKHARIGRRVGARRAPNWGLVDIDDLINLVDPFYIGMLAGLDARVRQVARQAFKEHLVDQRAFSGTGNARHSRKYAERNFNVDLFEVVFRRSDNL